MIGHGTKIKNGLGKLVQQHAWPAAPYRLPVINPVVNGPSGTAQGMWDTSPPNYRHLYRTSLQRLFSKRTVPHYLYGNSPSTSFHIMRIY